MPKTREIIQKYIGYTYSEGTRKVFVNWLKEPTNKEEKEAVLKEIWDELDVKADASTQKSYEAVLTGIRTTTPHMRKLSVSYRLARIAAVLMLPILSMAITYYIMKDDKAKEHQLSLVECIVPDGEVRTLMLPDSSIVKINSGSILIYPEHFTDKRDVFLNGEAYFTVARNETKPFTVKTTDMEVEVLGTTFNISSYSDNESSSTTLESGKVNVRFKNEVSESLILQPNEQVAYNRHSKLIAKSVVKVENVIAWTEGKLIIQGMTIEEIAKVIERRYALKVNLNAHKYKDERITMKVSHEEDITEFMNVLSFLVPQLKYRTENDTLYIY